MLIASDIVYQYGATKALDGLQFSIPAQALFGLLGPNGSGKSTFFGIASTRLKPQSGTCTIAGANVAERPDLVRHQLGVVFQQPALDLALSVRDNLLLHGALYGLSGGTLAARVAQKLDLLGLSDRAQERCRSLSGGLLRRVDLARSILHHPKLLLLDEPTNGLDPIARRAFWNLLKDLQQQQKITILVATHLMEEAEKCDELVIMNKGKAVCQGTPNALKSSLGSETLWVTADQPERLAAALRDKLAWQVVQFGAELCVYHDRPQELFGALYRDFGHQIRAAAIRKPTLEDVFLTHTGNHFHLDPMAA